MFYLLPHYRFQTVFEFSLRIHNGGGGAPYFPREFPIAHFPPYPSALGPSIAVVLFSIIVFPCFLVREVFPSIYDGLSHRFRNGGHLPASVRRRFRIRPRIPDDAFLRMSTRPLSLVTLGPASLTAFCGVLPSPIHIRSAVISIGSRSASLEGSELPP